MTRVSNIFLTIVFLVSASQRAVGDTLSATLQQVHQSVVLILNSKEHSSGSGVIVASDATSSEILTAAHVIGKATIVQVYIRDDPSTSFRAKVVKIDRRSDLALLKIEKGGLKAADIATDVKDGQGVVAVGYPVASFELLNATNELATANHEGIISAIHLGGRLLEHTALTDHGNSGGPLFDVESGYVVGIIRGMLIKGQGSFIATGYKAIQEFLSSSGVVTAADNAQSAVLRNVPGAFQIAVTHGAIVDSPDQASIRGAIDEHVLPRLEALFPGAMFRMTNSPQNDPESVAAFCLEQKVVAFLYVGESWSFTPPANIYVYPQVSAGLDVALIDCNFQTVIAAKKSKDVKSGSYVPLTAIVSSVDDLADHVTSDLLAQLALYPTTAKANLLRFGYLMEDGQKRAFFNLIPGPQGAIVSYAPSFGTAARAGVQRGLLVTSVNGHQTAGLSQSDLDALLTALPPSISLAVLNADGTSGTLSFQAQDIRWYLSHPATKHSL